MSPKRDVVGAPTASASDSSPFLMPKYQSQKETPHKQTRTATVRESFLVRLSQFVQESAKVELRNVERISSVFQPEGFRAISRWSSAANTTGKGFYRHLDPEGIIA